MGKLNKLIIFILFYLILNSSIFHHLVYAENLKIKNLEIGDSFDTPLINFRMINPTKYLVVVEGATKPFQLIFNQSFHPEWKLYSERNDVNSTMQFTPKDVLYFFAKPLNVEHMQINGYANSWYIDPQKLGLGKDFTLVIYFFPQSFYYLGIFISIISLTTYLFYFSIKKLTNNNKIFKDMK